MTDLFETPELIPVEIAVILNSFNDNEDSMIECARILEEIEVLGYTYDYYLDGVPCDLRQK
jgi:hypothetical protein